MANQHNSKVALANGEVLIDLTLDDVKPEHVQDGIWFHDKTGLRQKGNNKKTVDASGVVTEAAEVLDGRPFGKGNDIEYGTMPDNSGKDVIITNKEGTAIPVGYSDGTGRAKLSDEALANLIPENIKEGVKILDIEGEYGADDISSTSKEVTPTFEDKTYNPAEDGVTFYSSVKVNAIKVDRKDNEAGGVTVTIG